jgi:hypothetical protein
VSFEALIVKGSKWFDTDPEAIPAT